MSVTAIEAGLREKPDDWPAWQVYADHLTTEGDVRGELIRLEHERAIRSADQSAGAVAAVRDNARSRRLHNETRALTKQHEEQWREGLDHAVVVSWLHGFVSSVQLTWSLESVASLEKFLATPNARFLTRVGFPERGVSAESLSVVEAVAKLELPLLRCFSLAYTALGGPAVRAARRAKWFSSLVELDLRYCALRDEGVGELRGAELPRLHALRLQKNELSAAGVRALGTMTAPALRVLDLRYNPLGDDGARAFAELPFVPALTDVLIRERDVAGSAMAGLPLAAPLRRYWNAR
ncbi:MAG: hypothetical protein JNM17_19905 [Archangium sp.]|nr:hypothetical protein [Archangium sp.]